MKLSLGLKKHDSSAFNRCLSTTYWLLFDGRILKVKMYDIQNGVPHSWNKILKIRKRSFTCSKRKMNIEFELIQTFFNAIEYFCRAMNILFNFLSINIATRTSFTCIFINTPLYPWTWHIRYQRLWCSV